MRILVADGEAMIADLLVRSLGQAGYAVDVARDRTAALMCFEVETYDLIIVDVTLPGTDGGGLGLCRDIRANDTQVPLLMLEALDSPVARANELDAGADDSLVKPFQLVELLARVRALLRRAPRAVPPILEVQGVRLDPATRSAERGGRAISLTAKEYAVLEYLMRNAGIVVSSSELIDHAWDQNYDGVSNVVQTYIRYVRQKLTAAGEPDIIETKRGSGYVIRADR